MRDLGQLMDELFRTGRPPETKEEIECYDRKGHRKGLVGLIEEAESKLPGAEAQVTRESKGMFEKLFDELFRNFDSGQMNPWRAHNLFCIEIHKLIDDLKALVQEEEIPALGVAAG